MGEIVSDLINSNFSNIINVDFTAQMENELDMIAEGSLKWKDAIKTFYDDFTTYKIQ